MYTACLFCQSALGRNEALEAFPVGRRLAYDAARGRLWVVCRKCERWNLTPLEERWEAIEQAERLYRGTRLRSATDQVGLARLADGTELVRIGRPLRPELAAWRYGDQFGRRRRRWVATVAGAVAVGGTLVVAGPVLGLVSLGAISMPLQSANLAHLLHRQRQCRRLPLADGRAIDVPIGALLATRLVERGSGAWALRVTGHEVPAGAPPRLALRYAVELGREHELTGVDALAAARLLLPGFNRAGAGPARVREAVRLLDDTPDPAALFAGATAGAHARFRAAHWQWGEPGQVNTLPAAVRLALEMAVHEEQERAALAGELAALERAWRDAEAIAAIAAIADDLLLPDRVTRALARLRGDASPADAAR